MLSDEEYQRIQTRRWYAENNYENVYQGAWRECYREDVEVMINFCNTVQAQGLEALANLDRLKVEIDGLKEKCRAAEAEADVWKTAAKTVERKLSALVGAFWAMMEKRLRKAGRVT